jgi:hypothetical protein
VRSRAGPQAPDTPQGVGTGPDPRLVAALKDRAVLDLRRRQREAEQQVEALARRVGELEAEVTEARARLATRSHRAAERWRALVGRLRRRDRGR